MKILITGASGYIGKRLTQALIQEGHEVVCCVRDASRFNLSQDLKRKAKVVEVDFLNKESLKKIPADLDVAYYLLHSMTSTSDFESLELKCATNFRKYMDRTKVQQVIYLSGIVNQKSLSRHLGSRKIVETELKKGGYHFTTLRAGIIIGSGSASFEIIRDLVEKLPIMVTPKWLNTKCQPIGVGDVIDILKKSLLNERVFDRWFDIGGKDVLTYKEMLLGFAKSRNLKRRIYTLPIMTPKLSSYWLYFVTSTSYKLASSLVDSMKVEVVCQDHEINEILKIDPDDYETALNKTLKKIQGNEIPSSWKDSWNTEKLGQNLTRLIDVPDFGIYKDQRSSILKNVEYTKNKIWEIGGKNGWYYGNWMWGLRGLIDKMFGGVGLRRGRTHPLNLAPGDALDFWRVLYADKKKGHLVLFAEMKLPGEAWLEFKIKDNNLIQTATFRPKGLAGRIYWFALIPIHEIIFRGLIKRLTAKKKFLKS